MNIPRIGGARGIFEIFVPGMFLLLNIVAAFYFIPYSSAETKKFISELISKPTLSFVIIICFGYLIVVLLRLFRVALPDKCSACFIRKFSRHAKKIYALERFPYIAWIGALCKEYLDDEVWTFYKNNWKKRWKKNGNNPFLNFCKNLVISTDEVTANEIFAAEALTRYISGMFYALAFAFFLIFITIILIYFYSKKINLFFAIIFFAYSFSISAILMNLRFIRIKEVATVFTAHFKLEKKSSMKESSVSDSNKESPKEEIKKNKGGRNV
jgi:hypothetical protein